MELKIIALSCPLHHFPAEKKQALFRPSPPVFADSPQGSGNRNPIRCWYSRP